MSKYFDGEILSAYEDLNKEFECKKENTKLQQQIIELQEQLHSQSKEIIEKIRKWGLKHYNWVGDGTGYDGQDYNECIGFNMAVDQLNEILDAILNGVSYD